MYNINDNNSDLYEKDQAKCLEILRDMYEIADSEVFKINTEKSTKYGVIYEFLCLHGGRNLRYRFAKVEGELKILSDW